MTAGNLAKLGAAIAGIGLCAMTLTAWALPTSGSQPGLDLRLIAVPPGELALDTTGVIASAHAMQAGDDPAAGAIEVENITGRRLLVRPVALPSTSSVDRIVRIRATAGRDVIALGTLAAVRRPRGAGVEIPPRGSRRLEIAAWIPPGRGGYRGRILDVTLELRSRPLTKPG